MTAFTVPSEACQAQFQWTGVQTSFPCGFPALEATDLLVQYASGGTAGSFTGSIAGGVLTVTALTSGMLGPGAQIFGANVAEGTEITGYGSAAGETGTYTVNISQAVDSEAMTSGPSAETLQLGVHYSVALDLLSGNVTVSPVAMPDGGPGVVTVTRNTQAVQETQFNNLDSYQADAITAGLDRPTMLAAELKRRVASLETAAFGSTPTPPASYVHAPTPQRSIVGGGNLPITGADAILNVNVANALSIPVPLASSRSGVPLIFKNKPGSKLVTLTASGGDTFDGATSLPIAPGADVMLTPYNDTVNAGYAIATLFQVPQVTRANDAGFVGDGVAYNDAAFTAWFASLPNGGGALEFGAGKYLFQDQIAATLFNGKSAIKLCGLGANLTTLCWPNPAGGIALTAASGLNSVHIRDLTLSTGQANGGVAIALNGIASSDGIPPTSDIENVEIHGDDFVAIPPAGNDYWSIALDILSWSNVNLFNVNTWGPPAGAAGIGLRYGGDPTSDLYAVILNAIECSFNAADEGAVLNSYWQGVTFSQCNFNESPTVSTVGILGAGSQTGILSGLTIEGCEFGSCQEAIDLQSATDDIQIVNNIVYVTPANGIGINISAGIFPIIIGNLFAGASASDSVGIVIGTDAEGGIIQGNVSNDLTTGVSLAAGSSEVVVGPNAYNGVTTRVSNAGTGNVILDPMSGGGTGATEQATPSAPTGTTSTSAAVMMGLAGTITPTQTGRIFVMITGDVANSASGDGASVQGCYGTGSAPANASALTGTAFSAAPKFTAEANGQKAPFAVQGVVTGLALGTAVWLDLAVEAITGGTASVADITITAYEF